MSDLQTPKPVDIDVTRNPSPTQLFEAFNDKRRQRALEYLSHRGTVSLSSIVDRLARLEEETSPERRRQLEIELVHRHLPTLEDAELIAYDTTRRTVELLTDPTELAPFLALAAGRDTVAGAR